MDFGLASLIGALAIAVYTDLRAGKIPNQLVLIGTFAALAFHGSAEFGEGPLSVASGSLGLLAALSGIAFGFLALLPLYALRAMGAGDVKLMMMVGAFLGPQQTIGVVVLTFAAGGVLALAMAIWQRSFAQLTMNLRYMLTTSVVQAATNEHVRFEPLQRTAGRMPYAVAIAAGTLLQLFLVRSGGWALS